MRCLKLLVFLPLLPGFLLASTPVRKILNAKWEFSQLDKNKWFPAEVPGTVHTDLFRNGEIPDPYYGTNEKGLQWIGEVDWEYKTNLELPPQTLEYQKLALRFDGLDTYAEVYLNGELLINADNMFRSWEVECRSKLKAGKNELRIVFRSPIDRAKAAAASRTFPLPADLGSEADRAWLYVRKPMYHFGWEWGPRFVTMGIWRPVSVIAWNETRITDFHTQTASISENEARLKARVEVRSETAGPAILALILDGDTILRNPVNLQAGRNVLEQPFNIAKPQLWWPAGAGKPYLYQVGAALMREDKSLVDAREVRTGVRTIELVREADSLGEGFFFRINGRAIFIKGANYIPPDNFIPRGRAKRKKLFAAIEHAHMNMVRVWGGGIYEDDEFYRMCDEKGIMVWQDFMFSGGMYPGDTAFRSNVRAEVRDNIIRLRQHPSLALWCGNNAIESAWQQQAWPRAYNISTADSIALWKDYHGLFKEMIPAQVSELDPGRAYISSSAPARNDRFAVGNPADRADLHEDGLFSAFKDHTPRFMSEFGFQSYPEIRTLVPVTSGGGPDRESIDDRQTSKVDSRLVDTYMKRLYPEYKDYESFLVLSQLLQAEGMKVAIENMRIDQPNCMGSMYWQLNDCWPGPSSSTVDYEGRWKALQFWMQHLYAPIMLLAEQNEKGDLRVRATSDESRTRFGTIALRLKSFDGDILWTQEQTVEIIPDSVKVYLEVPRSIFPDRFDRSTTVLEVILHARGKILASNLLYFAPPKDMDLPDPEFSYRVSLAEGGGFAVEVRADHHLKNVEFALEGVEAEFSDNYFDLPPGGIREIIITAPSIKTEKEMMQKLRVRQMLDWVKEP